jgi:pyridoxine 5-phosphate synthase
MIKLNVNIDHIATLRQARLGVVPDVTKAAKIVEEAGADGITIHLREDRRHIQDQDVYALKKTVKTKLNLEMSAYPDIVKIALSLRPEWVTLVPEKRKELTTEGGLDVRKYSSKLGKITEDFHKKGVKVSFFINPDVSHVAAAHELKADFVEIHTGIYADAKNRTDMDKEFNRIKNAVLFAADKGLGINAGHGLDYENVKRLLKLGVIEEYSIGHSIISRSVFTGLKQAVKDMIDVLNF